MSLLVHLPFIEDLRSKGLIELPSFSKNGFTSNANGKLGLCYSGYGIVSLSEEILGNAWSVATWVKSTATWPTYNYIIFCKNISAANDCQIYFSIINGNSLNLGLNDTTSVGSFSYMFELDIWYHVAATYDGETYRLYINGAEVKSGTSTLPMVENRLHLGIGCRSYNAAGTSVTGQANGKFFNDFRLYNNAISAREVKELSKGLVAHWKLDDFIGNENLSISTPKYLNHNVYNAYQFSLTENLVSGNKYTIQLWDVDVSHSEKTESQLGVSVYWGGGSIYLCAWHGTGYFVNGHADHLSMTFTAPNSTHSTTANAWLNLYNSVGYVAGTMNMKIGRWKLEKGSTPTPWLPAKTDDMYPDWELDVAHDSSGYCHDGIFIGNPLFTLDSPRYLGCLKMVNGSHVSFTNLPTLSEFTIAFWAAQSTGSSYMVLGYSNGNRLNLYDLSNKFYWSTGDGTNNPFQDDSGVTVASTPYKGTIHHFAITGDGTQNLLYVDGVKIGKAKTYRSLTGSSLVVNGWATNSTAYSFNDRVSDIRIYATALSADDIKELYNTSASIDNHHNVYAREFVED